MSSSDQPPPGTDPAVPPPPPVAPAADPAAAATPAAETPSSTMTGLEIPPPTPLKSKRKSSRKRKPKAFTPGAALTSGLTEEMRNSKSSEEFENELEPTTVNRMVENVRNVIPSFSDLSLAFTTASKSVSDFSVAATGVAQKASKSVSDLSVAATGVAQKASKSVSDLSVAATGAAQKASEHAFTFSAAMSDMSQKVADVAKASMDTASAAKQRTTDAYKAASATASAVSEKVSAASKSISETTTAIMEGASAAKAKITEVSKAATEKAAAVSASVQENVKKAQEVSKVVVETAAPVVSAVSSGVAAAASSVSDAAVNLSSSSSGGGGGGATPAISDTNATTSSAEVIKEYMAATSSAATTAMSKFSNLSKSLSSIFSAGGNPNWGSGASTPPPYNARERNDSEFVALADLCPMPAVAYKATNHSPPNSEGGGSAKGDTSGPQKCNLTGENITVYDCEIEQTYQQSTGTNSFESVVLIKDSEINNGPMVKHPIIGQPRQARAVQLVGSELPTKRIEEWALRQLERAEEVPALALPQTRLGDREHWMIGQIVTRIQNKFMNMKRHDFTIDIKRGYASNGLPYLEVEVTPINSI